MNRFLIVDESYTDGNNGRLLDARVRERWDADHHCTTNERVYELVPVDVVDAFREMAMAVEWIDTVSSLDNAYPPDSAADALRALAKIPAEWRAP